jgi:hypothetical protein
LRRARLVSPKSDEGGSDAALSIGYSPTPERHNPDNERATAITRGNSSQQANQIKKAAIVAKDAISVVVKIHRKCLSLLTMLRQQHLRHNLAIHILKSAPRKK